MAIIMLVHVCLPAFAADDAWQTANDVSLGLSLKPLSNAHIPVPPRPLFWNATLRMDKGVMLSYRRLILHSEDNFSFYLGGSIEKWSHDTMPPVYGVSFLFECRLWPFHTRVASPYLLYSIASPTILSRRYLGHTDLGSSFIFQDMLGLGVQLGQQYPVLLEVDVMHYSNGYVFPINSGFDVPLLIRGGYAF